MQYLHQQLPLTEPLMLTEPPTHGRAMGEAVPWSWELSPGAADSMTSLQQELEWGAHLRYQMSWDRNVMRRMWEYKAGTEGESWTMGSPS